MSMDLSEQRELSKHVGTQKERKLDSIPGRNCSRHCSVNWEDKESSCYHKRKIAQKGSCFAINRNNTSLFAMWVLGIHLYSEDIPTTSSFPLFGLGGADKS